VMSAEEGQHLGRARPCRRPPRASWTSSPATARCCPWASGWRPSTRGCSQSATRSPMRRAPAAAARSSRRRPCAAAWPSTTTPCRRGGSDAGPTLIQYPIPAHSKLCETCSAQAKVSPRASGGQRAHNRPKRRRALAIIVASGFHEHDRITTVAGLASPAARGRMQELAEARALAHRNAACVHVMSFQEKAAGIFEAPSRTATASASGAGLVLNCAASTLYMARPWAGAHSRMGELLCVLVSSFQIGRHQGEPASSACPEARTALWAVPCS